MNGPIVYRTSLTTASHGRRTPEGGYAGLVTSLLDGPLGGVETVVLATCERVEIYASHDDGSTMRQLHVAGGGSCPMDRATGVDAVRHLFRVAAGLDSRIPGEPHILGQVRSALVHAVQGGTAGLTLTPLFRAAIDCGRRVRRRSALGAGGDSYVVRTNALLQSALGPLADRHVAVVGTGALARDLAHTLRAGGVGRLTIVGRHVARVEGIARDVAGHRVTLDAFRGGLACDAIVTAVSSAEPILDGTTIAACRPRLVIDLGAPPNVAGGVTAHAVPMVGLAELGGGGVASAAATNGAMLVEREVARFVARHGGTWHERTRRLAS